jgi:multicomponent Na+:H+ antiporter subunit F
MEMIVFLTLIGMGIILCILRILKGPTSPDRAVGLDTFCTVSTALLVLLGYFFRRSIYLDVAMVYAVLTFVGSVAIARFLEKGI